MHPAHPIPLLFAVLLLLLAGCQQAPTTTVPATRAPAQQTPADMLREARSLPEGPRRQEQLLAAIDGLQSQGEWQRARQLLLELSGTLAPGELQNQYLLLAMRGAVHSGDRTWAATLARKLGPARPFDYPPQLQVEAARLAQAIHELANNPLGAAHTSILARQRLDAVRSLEPFSQERIWRWLQKTPTARLEEALAAASSSDAQGWFSLALQLSEGPLTLEQQAQRIRQWQQDWPTHPASLELPPELALIAQLPDRRPERITLTLPLSGPLSGPGTAVMRGFFGAYYEDQQAARRVTEIRIVDTGQSSFNQIYAAELENNPNLIVGPLSKTALGSLLNQDSLPVPVLALNYADSASPVPANLFQFGLSAEDEARQIAQRLDMAGHERVVVIAPEGAWGDRVTEVFQTAYASLDGKVLDQVRFSQTDSLKLAVAKLFGIQDSRQRAIRVEQTIAMDVTFEPRRRQDIEAVVMIAPPAKARQINPLFAFYFGGELPVYSPSLVYTGEPDPQRDADLDGVRFTDIPWILGRKPPLRQTLEELFPAATSQYGRLFALGVDAYRLASRLPLLQTIPDSQVTGYTGLLSMTESGLIERQQAWARFRSGTPVVLEDQPANLLLSR